ncbi:1,4-dihydroxy-2-naphthoate polyprenyltransferase [Glaciihabitans arcticus]|uniref:1,4-dihydroxy-2-naphthoate octaprenyltransferase n=1 Tax=Glaciihabitans arcticus TaxID=2668039 RepID=A0A4V2JFA2_9MICO|nr:1,4-dihydroxy-2-naphthoate polyprenyltransferase [Glaciihabitans arcticus]TBN58679.1 1,4-dihydroxy-2-naphthoate polyprenyltransferase [Glaciihabitans arcticus]
MKKATARDWIAGARLRTLPLAIAPVAVGTAVAYILGDNGEFHWRRALLCLIVALSIQIAVNYANDYSDGVRGTDKHRVGPSRLTGSGAAKPRTVLTVALAFFGIAAVAGLVLAIGTGYYWLIAVGAVCIVAAWFYTGGKRPYGYNALGEVFVFVFFGLVATAGTTFVQAGTVSVEAWAGGTALGFFACAVLIVNNLRDIEQDRIAGKRTLSVLIGARASRILFGIFMILPFVILVGFTLLYFNTAYGFVALMLALPAVIIVSTAKTPPEFILALKLASLASLVYGIVLALAIAL